MYISCESSIGRSLYWAKPLNMQPPFYIQTAMHHPNPSIKRLCLHNRRCTTIPPNMFYLLLNFCFLRGFRFRFSFWFFFWGGGAPNRFGFSNLKGRLAQQIIGVAFHLTHFFLHGLPLDQLRFFDDTNLFHRTHSSSLIVLGVVVGCTAEGYLPIPSPPSTSLSYHCFH